MIFLDELNFHFIYGVNYLNGISRIWSEMALIFNGLHKLLNRPTRSQIGQLGLMNLRPVLIKNWSDITHFIKIFFFDPTRNPHPLLAIPRSITSYLSTFYIILIITSLKHYPLDIIKDSNRNFRTHPIIHLDLLLAWIKKGQNRRIFCKHEFVTTPFILTRIDLCRWISAVHIWLLCYVN